MAAQTHQLVNGQWQTVTMNATDLLARANEADNIGLAQLPPPAQMPTELGLLARTVIKSPVVRWIFPAKLRGKGWNDIVAIGENYIELYNLKEDGRMELVSTNTNFAGSIKSALVIPLQGYKENAGIKSEPGIEGSSPAQNCLPPEILMIALDTGFLMAMVVEFDEGGELKWRSSMYELDKGGRGPEKLGYSLHVDPSSRCFVVTSLANQYIFQKLLTYTLLNERFLKRESIMPFEPKSGRSIGYSHSVLIGATFLYPAPEEPNHAFFLAVFVDDFSHMRLALIEWDTTTELRDAKRGNRTGLRLSDDIKIPTHIIAIPEKSAFALVTELNLHIGTISDIQCGNSNLTHSQGLPHPHFVDHRPTYQLRPNLIAGWTRMQEGPYGFFSGIFLIYEKGHLYHLTFNPKSKPLQLVPEIVARLDTRMGPAFCYATAGQGQFLVGCGEASKMGVFTMDVRKKFEPGWHFTSAEQEETPLRRITSSWAPCMDFAVVDKTGEASSSAAVHGSSVTDSLETIYLCSGMGREGNISELKTGVEAQVQTCAEYLPYIRSLYVLTESNSNGFFILSSMAERSTLAYLTLNGEWESIEQHSGLDLETPTVLAISFIEGVIQVTSREVRFGKLIYKGQEEQEKEGKETWLVRTVEEGEEIVGASMVAGNLVLAMRRGENVHLVAAVVDLFQEESGLFLRQVGGEILLFDNPASISLLSIQAAIFAVVGTRDATIQIYRFNPKHGLEPVLEESLKLETNQGLSQVESDAFICESAALLQSKRRLELLCGLRGGGLIYYEVKMEEGRALHFNISGASSQNFAETPSLTSRRELRLGTVAVKLQEDPKRPSTTLCQVGNQVLRLSLPQSGASLHAGPVIFKGLHNKSILTFAQVLETALDETIIIGINSSNQIFYAGLSNEEKVVAKQYRLGDTPVRIFWYGIIGRYIVACQRVCDGKRFLNLSCCYLQFFNPKRGTMYFERELRDAGKDSIIIFNKQHERIYCMEEWNYHANNSHYSYIVLGTGYKDHSPSTNTYTRKGRLLILSISLDPRHTNTNPDHVAVRRRAQFPVKDAVTAICAVGNDLVIAAGEELIAIALDSGSTKLRERGGINLRTRVRELKLIKPNLLVASTATESLMTIEITDSPAPSQGATSKLVFTPLTCEPKARFCVSSLSLAGERFVATMADGSVTLLEDLGTGARVKNELFSHVDGVLKNTVSKLRVGGVDLSQPRKSKASAAGTVTLTENGRRILGIAVDGSIVQFEILAPTALKLLEAFYTVLLNAEGRKGEHEFYVADGVVDVDWLGAVWKERDGGEVVKRLEEGGFWEREGVSGWVETLGLEREKIWEWVGGLVGGRVV